MGGTSRNAFEMSAFTTQTNQSNMKKIAFLIPAIALAAMPAVSAATVLIDFGRSTNVASGYTSVAMTTEDTSDATSGTVSLGATGWSIVVTETGTGVSGASKGGNAGSGADDDVFPAAVSGFNSVALEDSIYGSLTATGGPTDFSQLTITISGLSNSDTYDLLFYGSRGNSNGLNQTWSLTQGTGGADVTHNSLNNESTAVDWNGVSTNGSGVIAFTITGPTGTTGALALNCGEITAIPEPSAALLGGLGFLMLLRRRR